ncbi:TPA: hypothetical protein ACPXF4_002167 [Streptococcus suis]
MVIAFCRKPLAGSLMISAKVLCSNHPEEATLPLRCLATATPLWTCRPGTIASNHSWATSFGMFIANSHLRGKIKKMKI